MQTVQTTVEVKQVIQVNGAHTSSCSRTSVSNFCIKEERNTGAQSEHSEAIGSDKIRRPVFFFFQSYVIGLFCLVAGIYVQ